MWWLTVGELLINNKALVGLIVVALYATGSTVGCGINKSRISKLQAEVKQLEGTVAKLNNLRKADAKSCEAKCIGERVKCLDKKLKAIDTQRKQLKEDLRKERKRRKVIARRVRSLPPSKLPRAWKEAIDRSKVKPCSNHCVQRWRYVLRLQ